MAEDGREATLRWKIDKDIELYRFYLDVSVKASVFLMAVTGAIASYVLSKPDSPIISIALAFPAVVNVGFTVLFFYSIKEAERIERVHVEASKELGVPAFNMNPLKSVCQIFCFMCALAALGLLVLMVFQLRGGWGQLNGPTRNANTSWVAPTAVTLPSSSMSASVSLPSREPLNLRFGAEPSQRRSAPLFRAGQAAR